MRSERGKQCSWYGQYIRVSLIYFYFFFSFCGCCCSIEYCAISLHFISHSDEIGRYGFAWQHPFEGKNISWIYVSRWIAWFDAVSHWWKETKKGKAFSSSSKRRVGTCCVCVCLYISNDITAYCAMQEMELIQHWNSSFHSKES